MGTGAGTLLSPEAKGWGGPQGSTGCPLPSGFGSWGEGLGALCPPCGAGIWGFSAQLCEDLGHHDSVCFGVAVSTQSACTPPGW